MAFMLKQRIDWICKFWREAELVNVGLNGERLPTREFEQSTTGRGHVDLARDLSLIDWGLPRLCSLHCTPSIYCTDWCSGRICWMNEYMSQLVGWGKSVTSDFRCPDSSGIPGWQGLSPLQISSFSALRFLLLLWERCAFSFLPIKPVLMSCSCSAVFLQ